MASAYSIYLAFYLYLFMVLTQWAIATVSKAKQPNATPGKLDESLSHDSFVFRAHRTFHNTLENSLFFVGPMLLAFSMHHSGLIFSISAWIYLVARVIHMALYYTIATSKNPSPRSYFLLIGVLANVVMLIALGSHFI